MSFFSPSATFPINGTSYSGEARQKEELRRKKRTLRPLDNLTEKMLVQRGANEVIMGIMVR